MQIQNISIQNYLLVWGIFLISLFSFLNPTATSNLDIITATVTWVFNICLPLVILTTLQVQLQNINLFNQVNSWLKIVLVALFATLVFTPLAISFDQFFDEREYSRINSNEFWLEYLAEFTAILFPLTLCWLIINAPFLLRLNFNPLNEIIPKPDSNKSAAILAKNTSSFIAKISKRIGTDIIYMKSELHYTKVVSATGKELILYNFSEAMQEIERLVEGVQIHRSYWVAKEYIFKVTNQELILLSGEKIPVSRRKMAEVKKYFSRLSKNHK
jgi:hypothetical protein